jgi:hypothetical protein
MWTRLMWRTWAISSSVEMHRLQRLLPRRLHRQRQFRHRRLIRVNSKAKTKAKTKVNKVSHSNQLPLPCRWPASRFQRELPLRCA